MLKVMIVDDEKHCLEELQQILAACSSYEVCGEYTDAFSAMEALQIAVPDILIVDFLMPGMSGIGLTMQVKQLYPDISTVLMTEKPGLAVEGYEVGVSGVILKPLTDRGVMKTLGRITRLPLSRKIDLC
jgi:YesN/AraC family two-component response regulator